MELSEAEMMTPKSHLPTYLTLALVVALAVGSYFFFSQRNLGSPGFASPSPAMTNSLQPSVAGINAVTDSEAKAQVIQVEGGSYYYEPSEIRVKLGQPVTIRLTSVDKMHDFVIDELDVASDTAETDETVEVNFTPDRTGEFEFYCSIEDHRENGMVGTLIVTE